MVHQGDAEDLDPFWATVRRRQPDVDLILLPDDATRDEPLPAPDPGLLKSLPPVFDDWTARFWDRIVPDVPESEPTSRWTAGEAPGVLDRVALAAQEDVARDDGRRAISTATGLLQEDGFDGVAPSSGMPRVLASRQRDGRTHEVQVVWVPDSGRLALSVRWAPVVVGREAADQALQEPT